VIRVLGAAWTWTGEPLDPSVTPPSSWDGKPVLYDFNNSLSPGAPSQNIQPKVWLGILDGPTLVGGQMYVDDGFSPLRASNGSIPVIQTPQLIRYKAQFQLVDADPATILLATPVLDDVTVYWEDGGTHVVSYVYHNRSF
jgi:hypothetical protein